jgi:hypothetical protein
MPSEPHAPWPTSATTRAGAPASVRRHRGPVRPRARRQAAARLRPRRGARHPTEPRPNLALRFTLAQAFRIAAETHTPYVGTEHLVVAMLWEDYGDGLRRQASATPRPPTVRRSSREPHPTATAMPLAQLSTCWAVRGRPHWH